MNNFPCDIGLIIIQGHCLDKYQTVGLNEDIQCET